MNTYELAKILFMKLWNKISSQSNIWQIEDHMHQYLKLVDHQKQKQHTKLRQRNLLRKTLRKQNPTKTAPPLESKEVVVKPVDHPEELVPLHPPNQPDQLPDIPPNQPDQLPNNPPNSLTLKQIHLNQQQNPPSKSTKST